MKIYVVCDVEGVAGVISHRQQCQWDTSKDWYARYLDQARRFTTLELNAAVEGALEGGASEIIAWDGHGPFPGCIDIELLHPECKLLMGAGDGGPIGLDSSFDAMFQIGLHAMADTKGAVLCHGRWTLNGTAIGEIGMNSFIAGHYDVPCVFVSGDRAAADEARALIPNIETAVVKESLVPEISGLSQIGTVSLSLKKARQVIKESAKNAMSKIGSVEPCRFDPPYILQWRFTSSAQADIMKEQLPDAISIDPLTLEFRADKFEDLPI
jgi:D-amino peptidase